MSRGGPDDISVAYLISPITLTPRCLRPVTYHRLCLRYSLALSLGLFSRVFAVFIFLSRPTSPALFHITARLIFWSFGL